MNEVQQEVGGGEGSNGSSVGRNALVCMLMLPGAAF